MPSLKELRGRIAGVKSTRKITNAMKMVAASKLRRAQSQAEAARPYAEAMGRMMAELAAAVSSNTDAADLPPLLAGTGQDRTHLVVVLTSDRGLAGGFNANVVRNARQLVQELQAEDRTVHILPVGRKGADILAREYPDAVMECVSGSAGREVSFDEAEVVGAKIVSLLNAGEIDRCTIVFNRFVNAMTQVPTRSALVPLTVEKVSDRDTESVLAPHAAQYEFEPGEASLLEALLPRNLKVQIFSALLESAAGEQGARMTAMDNASRNASKAIDRLSQKYNRTRQANITNELIEIISGADAV